MQSGADILFRLLKVGLFGLALLVAAVGLAPSASAHGAGHHPSMHAAAAPPAAAIPIGAAPSFAAAAQPDAGCPGDDHRADHSGCCAGDHCCSVSCGAAAALPQLADLPRPASFPPIAAATPRSDGVGTGPGEHPPRPIV
jgi:hypothetical protein